MNLSLLSLTELLHNIVMDDKGILANIFSKSVLLKNYMLILNGGKVRIGDPPHT